MFKAADCCARRVRCSGEPLHARHRVDAVARPAMERIDSIVTGSCIGIKKRHVERVTRLPTKRMATACWDFIVSRTPPLEAAPLLDFSSLHVANKKSCTQVVHK
jgi:hypothetical protein